MASPTDPFGTGVDKTFPNDPYAPPRAPAPARSSLPVAPPQGAPIPGDSAPTVLLENPAFLKDPNKAPIYRAVKTRDGAGWEMFVRTEDGAKSLGKANIKDADVVFKDSGVFDDVSQAYTVPEDVVNKVTSGRLPFPEYLAARFESGEAGVIRNFIGRKYLSGEMKREDAVARGHDPLLKVQLGEAPEFAWDGGFAPMVVSAIRHPGEAFRFAAGEAAEQLPIMKGALLASLKGAAEGAAAGLALTASTGGLAAPLAVPAVRVGAGARSLGYFIDMEAGSTAMEMLEKGYDDKTIRRIAPLAGVVKGTLEQASFGVMTAPFKRAFVRNVMLSATMKSALVRGAAQYAKSVGAEVTTEELQALVDIMANDWASIVEEKPQLFTNAKEAKKQLWETFVKTAAAAGLMGAPGAVLDEMHSRSASTEKKGEAAKPATEKPAAKAPEKTLAPNPSGDKEMVLVDAPAPIELKTEPIVEAPPAATTDTYDSVQKEIDARENELEAQGVNLSKMRDKAQMTGVFADLPLPEGGSWMPADLSALYARRDAIGSAQLKESISELSDALVGAGVPESELKIILSKYSLDPDRTDGQSQYLASEHAPAIAGTDFQQQAENIYIALATNRGLDIALDKDGEIRNPDQKLIDLSVRAVEAIQDYFNPPAAAEAADFYDMVDGPVAALTEGTPEQAADAMVEFDEQENGLVPLEPPAAPIEGELDFYEAEERGLAKLKDPKFSDSPDYADPIQASWTDIFTPDPHLAQKNPMYAMIVLGVDAMRAKHGAVYTEFREALFDLGKKATESRARGLADKLAPQMKEVFDFLNAETPAAEKAAWEKLTPQEKKFAGFARAALDRAYEYLVTVEGMKSRFAPEGEKGYTPYTPKPMSEIIRGLPENGWKKTLKSLWESGVKRFDSDFSLSSASGKISRPKFFKHALFRSGEIDPSLNIIKTLDNYFRAFSAKRALDEASPIIEAGVREFVAHTDQKNPAVKALNQKLEKFIGQYMAKEKGQSILNDVIPHGSGGEALLRGTSALMSLLRIAGNIKLQAISGVGEAVSASGAVGVHGLSLGEYRLFWPSERAQAQRILKKYESFVGESPVVEFSHPGRNLEDQFRAVSYGILGWSRANIMHAAFLASMTDEEFKAGEISDARIAGLKVTLGRFMGLPGNRSALGATPFGLNATQFKAWAIPTMLTVKEDVGAMVRSFMETGNPTKKLTPLQKLELTNMAVTLGIAALGSYAFLGTDPKKDGPAARKLRQEIWSLLGALDPVIVLGVGATIPWLLRVAAASSMLARGMVTPRREGKRMRKQGWSRLVGENTPSALKQFQKKKKRSRR